MTPNDELIRRRAQQIWVEHGRPAGSGQEHWLQAEQEIAACYDEDGGIRPLTEDERNDPEAIDAKFDQVSRLSASLKQEMQSLRADMDALRAFLKKLMELKAGAKAKSSLDT